jgi:hypothetical protein
MANLFPALCILLFSCEKESNYRFAGQDVDDGVKTADVSGYPADGSLAFHENFRAWKRDGYVNLIAGDCETDQMTSSIIMYHPDKPVKRSYNGFSVVFDLQDFAVNPLCGNAVDTASRGYLALQQLIFYECGQHDSDAFVTLSELPSVSMLRFAASRTGDAKGLALWKKSGGEGSFSKIGDYFPGNLDESEEFSVDIHEKNVQLKFTPALTGKENPVNDGITRAVRIHDLWVWSEKFDIDEN